MASKVQWHATEESIQRLTRINVDWHFINGPSKFDLMISLFEGSPSAGTQKVLTYRVENLNSPDGVNIEARIESVAREDGSGESWVIEGWVVGLDGSKVHSLFMRGYYNTANRRGSVGFRYNG